MTTRQAADHLQRSTRYVLDAARCGELVGYQNRAPHGSWRFKLSDLDGWLERGR
ncbi:helix-turn-helix domain-containing protein [Rhodococcus sp. 14-2496-1d]|uniref:helix-turn-helix domain-containing protein n=1 Tax=Rhodococcus sp. 14-2496-1d TaxID=2023146 RepID=UPI001179CF0B